MDKCDVYTQNAWHGATMYQIIHMTVSLNPFSELSIFYQHNQGISITISKTDIELLPSCLYYADISSHKYDV